MQTALMPNPKLQFFDDNGQPLANGLLYTYQPGTVDILKATYKDGFGSAQNTNPVVLDGSGRAEIWLDGYYNVLCYDSAGNLMWSVDNVSSMADVTVAAADQWSVLNTIISYISPGVFSVPADMTDVLVLGSRIRATILSGIVYGTVSYVNLTNSPTATTVTVIWDATPIDASISAVSISPVSLLSLPVRPVQTFTANHTIIANDANTILEGNSASPLIFTLPAPNAVASGTVLTISSIGAGALTIAGTINGKTNPTMISGRTAFLHSNGIVWSGFVPEEPTENGLLSPVGEVKMYAGTVAPTGFLECDGSAVSRTTYAALFAAIGETWGIGNGTSTFNLPDTRGEFIRGWDHGRGVDAARVMGSAQAHATEDLFVPMDNEGETIITTGLPSWNGTHDVAGGVGDQDGSAKTQGILLMKKNTGETRGRNVTMMHIIKY